MPARKLLEISQARAGALIDAILERRRGAGDPDLDRASDDVAELVAYVAGCRRVPALVLREDILDALELLEHARANLPAKPGVWDRLEGRPRGGVLSLAGIAERLGTTRQGIDARARRAAAAEEGLARSEVAERVARRSRAAIERWHRDRAPAVRTAAAILGAHGGELDDPHAELLVETVLDVLTAEDARGRPPAVTDPLLPADVALFARAVRAAAASPGFAGLADGSRVRAAVERGLPLVGEYEALTAEVARFRRD